MYFCEIDFNMRVKQGFYTNQMKRHKQFSRIKMNLNAGND
jgi:hypothetical protein